MKHSKDTVTNWTICKVCKGHGKKSKGLTKKARLEYQKTLLQFEKSGMSGPKPIAPKAHLHTCANCNGSGLVVSENIPQKSPTDYPHIAIIGGGIGGVALAVACLHRQIPFTLYERDSSFDARSQGYGLTLQQARKAVESLGVFSLKEGITSTRHIVHNTTGDIIGQWGIRKWLDTVENNFSKKTNIHIARQSLRLALLEQLGEKDIVQWNHQLLDYNESEQGVSINFMVDGKIKKTKADLVVGADGIRSTVRSLLIGENVTPLRYLNCIVILGICPLSSLTGLKTDLLDSATVFQTANGNERIYMMPFNSHSIMWQLSFPMPEEQAKALSALGSQGLKEEACKRTQWHQPIPQILEATQLDQVSGYPVYDRELLKADFLEHAKQVTLIGDAAHPMSPFKGQGANQALLDALSLARQITKSCGKFSEWRKNGLKSVCLVDFESEMIDRTAIKVNDSAAAATFLHSKIALYQGDEPRGRCLKRGEV